MMHLSVNISQKALVLVEGKVLLVLEDTGWELPGGRVNQEETDLTGALKREIKEELSAQITPKNLYTAYLFQKTNGDSVLMLVYECELISSLETIRIAAGEILDWKLFSKTELTELKNLYPNSIQAIEKFLSK